MAWWLGPTNNVEEVNQGNIRNMSHVLVQRPNSLEAWALVRPFLFSCASTTASGAEVRAVRHTFRGGVGVIMDMTDASDGLKGAVMRRILDRQS